MWSTLRWRWATSSSAFRFTAKSRSDFKRSFDDRRFCDIMITGACTEAIIDKNKFNKIYGYGSKWSFNRAVELRMTQTASITPKMMIKVQEPPKEATLSAMRWPKVSRSSSSKLGLRET